MTRPQPNPKTALRGGLIGCGYVANSHLAAWRRQTLGTIVAVCDLDRERSREAAGTYGIPKEFDSAERMFKDCALDFVEICTRPDTHESLVQLAAGNRLAILCQKPLAGDLATIDRMIETCRSHHVRCMVHENWRFRPWYVQLAEEVRKGTIGDPVRLRIQSHDFRCLAPGGMDDQPYFRTMNPFILYEMGPHLVDVARNVLGDPCYVFAAHSRIADLAGEDAAHLVLGYPNGEQAILDMCWSTVPNPQDHTKWGLVDSVVEGTRGALRNTRDGHLLLTRPNGTESIITVPMTDDPRLESYVATQRHFLQRLIDGKPFVTDIVDNRQAMRVIFAGYESAERHTVVRLD